MAIKVGSRVEIKSTNPFTGVKCEPGIGIDGAFAGQTGTVVGFEKCGEKLWRVRLDQPVTIPGMEGLINSDLWATKWLIDLDAKAARKTKKQNQSITFCQCGRESVSDQSRYSEGKIVPHCPRCEMPCSACPCDDVPSVGFAADR